MELELTENRFDATVVGTGLTQSILAAALSQAGKKVLHLDAAEYYSSHWASLNLKEFHQFLLSNSCSRAQPEQTVHDPVHRMPRPFVHGEVFANPATLEDVASKFRSYSIDITPRVIYARGSLVDLMIRSGVGKYMEFRPVNDTYLISDAGRGIRKVPVSRSDVFQSTELSMAEKRLLMKAVQTITSLDPVAAQSTNASALEKLSEDAKELKNWYERPFIDYLRAQNTPAAVCNVLLYALAFADTDQMNTESRRLLTTHQATDRINLFVKSIGRYSDGAFLFPLYGGGEIPQAFSRSCAVFGGTYILRYSPTALTVNPEEKAISGVIGPGNQFIQSEAAVCEPEYIVPGMSHLYRVSEEVNREDLVWAHATCILDSPLTMADGSPISPLSVVVIPPNVLGNPNMVRVLQVDSTLSVVPNGKFIVYLSTLSSTYSISVTTNKASVELGQTVAKLINVTALSQVTSAELPTKKKPTDAGEQSAESDPSAPAAEEAKDSRPKALYVAYYYQVHRPVRVHEGPVVLRKKEEQPAVPAGSEAAASAVEAPAALPSEPAAPAESATPAPDSEDTDHHAHETKPKVPLAVMPEKSQVIQMDQQTPCARPSNLFLTSPPSGFMDYTEEVQEAEEIFRALCPDAEFLPVPKEAKKKPTFFEDDPEGLASLSDDEKDQADADLLAEAAEAAASAVDFAADTATSAAADAVADGAAGSLLDAAAESVLGAGGQ